MAIAAAATPRPRPSAVRFRIATAVSFAFHLLVVLLVGLIAVGEPTEAPMEPIEVSLLAAPAPKPAEVVVQATPEPTATLLPGGGARHAKVVRNPSPIRSSRPSSRPASNAGGKAKAAFGAPRILTSKSGTTPAGQVGRGSAPFGPGGQEEVPGGGPTYGPGVGGGPEPIYPKHALDRGLEGTVTLLVAVSANGAVERVAVASSSGHALLDQAAVRAVQKDWQFTPGVTKGKPAGGKVKMIFHFSGGVVKRG